MAFQCIGDGIQTIFIKLLNNDLIYSWENPEPNTQFDIIYIYVNLLYHFSLFIYLHWLYFQPYFHMLYFLPNSKFLPVKNYTIYFFFMHSSNQGIIKHYRFLYAIKHENHYNLVVVPVLHTPFTKYDSCSHTALFCLLEDHSVTFFLLTIVTL